jgi:hypothetical protein
MSWKPTEDEFAELARMRTLPPGPERYAIWAAVDNAVQSREAESEAVEGAKRRARNANRLAKDKDRIIEALQAENRSLRRKGGS